MLLDFREAARGGIAADTTLVVEYGEVGPKVPELEKQLFGGESQMRQGEHTEQLEFEVTVEASEKFERIRRVC